MLGALFIVRLSRLDYGQDEAAPENLEVRGEARMKRQLMMEQWDEFARRILPANCSQVQRQETRRAFYAGAQAILFRVIAAFAPEAEPTAEDLQVMEDLDQELRDFAKLIEQGRA